MNRSAKRTMRTIVYVVLFLWILFILYTLAQFPEPVLGMAVRAAALFGYTTLFLSIVSSEYIREMRQLFGKPFLTVHHFMARIGLALIVLHPLAFALRRNSLSVFMPVFSPLQTFLALAGRPALYLILIAVLAGVFRNRIKNTWKFIHWLNYLAFGLVFIHAWLIGSDVASGFLRIAWAGMAGIVLLVFVHKRLVKR